MKVDVEKRLDGTWHLTYNVQDLRFREITKKSAKDTSETPLLLQEKINGLLQPILLGRRAFYQRGECGNSPSLYL
jgi:hypothetical protein